MLIFIEMFFINLYLVKWL